MPATSPGVHSRTVVGPTSPSIPNATVSCRDSGTSSCLSLPPTASPAFHSPPQPRVIFLGLLVSSGLETFP